ncbi:MAG TPA: hypothetical protein DDY91_20250 [Planctomycetaceae bacterium]|nr:hypothetical protein [Planctomycetaceae bacterium]
MMRYLKAAFLNRWNLLLFSGGMAAAAISGRFDIVAPLVTAAELAYLGFIGTHPTFRRYVDIQAAPPRDQADKARAETLSRQLYQQLTREDRQRFDEVRERCEELQQLALRIQGPGVNSGASRGEGTEGLDRLLWMFLKLLHTRRSVSTFLRQTDVRGIEHDIQVAERNLKTLQVHADDPSLERKRRLLEETLQTSKTRLENYNRAQANLEVMDLELHRLENTIHSLGELAVTRNEPTALSDKIDLMAESMLQTERAMGELRLPTSLDLELETVPQILRSPVIFEK